MINCVRIGYALDPWAELPEPVAEYNCRGGCGQTQLRIVETGRWNTPWHVRLRLCLVCFAERYPRFGNCELCGEAIEDQEVSVHGICADCRDHNRAMIALSREMARMQAEELEQTERPD